MGSTLPDYSSREGVWGGSPGLVSGGGSGVGAHVDRYFFSGIRLLGPSFLAPGMRIVISFYTLCHVMWFPKTVPRVELPRLWWDLGGVQVGRVWG